MNENIKCKRWLGQYLACGQNPGMSFTPLINHRPILQAFNASTQIKELLNVPNLMSKKMLHLKAVLEKLKASLSS